MTNPPALLLKSALCILTIATTATAAERFFTPPDAALIMGAKDKVEVVTLPKGDGKANALPVESAQTMIDQARAQNPSAFLVIEASGLL